MNNKFMKKIKKVRISDIFSMFIFIVTFPIGKSLKMIKNNLWLIMESGFEARDNGYWLFKYIKEEHPEVNVAFVISKNSPDYSKVKELGEVIEYKSLKHWIYYFAARVNISTQKAGNPNAFLFYILEVVLNLSKNRVFLQHGITLSDAEWLYYRNTKFRLFVCAASDEFNYISKNFGYPIENVKLLGFPRFDSLENNYTKKSIIIMPSWRNWLVNYTDNQLVSNTEIDKFKKSKYYIKWSELLNDQNLQKMCKKNNIEINFFPHRNIQPYLHLFTNKEINVMSWEDYDIQDLLNTSSLLITDYSSVSLDFSYLNKPVIYYQFDEEEFRLNQYSEGYFNYKTEGFGIWSDSLELVRNSVEELIENDFTNNKLYTDRVKRFFGKQDKKNCERNFNEIERIIKGGI